MSLSSSVRKFPVGLALAATLFVTACEGDNNPYGPPFRTIFDTIVGAYRPIELLERPLPFLEGRFQPAPDGSDIRFVFGSTQSMTGRVFVPGVGPGGSNLDHRLYGEWSYDVPAQQLIIDFEPSVPMSPPRMVFQITILQDRIRITGTADLAGVPLSLDLAKPLPPEDAPGGATCPNCPAFNRAPMR